MNLPTSSTDSTEKKSPFALSDHLPKLEGKGWWVKYDESDKSQPRSLSKSFTFADFIGAFGFMTKISLKSESMNHHPDWMNVYNKVEITWNTHDCNGITELDIKMAHFCDEIYSKV